MEQIHKMKYPHNGKNVTLLFVEPNKYVLMSYDTIVLEIVNNEILINAHGRNTVNYTGIKSVTTSKHITQALDWLKNEGLIK